jgi:hypothetical protein
MLMRTSGLVSAIHLPVLVFTKYPPLYSDAADYLIFHNFTVWFAVAVVIPILMEK